MCESKAVVYEDGVEKSIMDEVALMEFKGGKLVMYSISGDRLELENYAVYRIDFINHKIYLAKK